MKWGQGRRLHPRRTERLNDPEDDQDQAADEGEGLRGRRGAAEDDAIDVGVSQRQFSGDENLFDQEVAAQGVGIVVLDVFRVMPVTHVQFHWCSSRLFQSVQSGLLAALFTALLAAELSIMFRQIKTGPKDD